MLGPSSIQCTLSHTFTQVERRVISSLRHDASLSDRACQAPRSRKGPVRHRGGASTKLKSMRYVRCETALLGSPGPETRHASCSFHTHGTDGLVRREGLICTDNKQPPTERANAGVPLTPIFGPSCAHACETFGSLRGCDPV